MYYIGIDGGGTKTKAIIIDELKNIIATGISGPSSVDTVTLEETKNNIEEAISKALVQTDIINFSCEALFAGLGGITGVDVEEEVELTLKNLKYVDKNTKIKVKSDVYNALAGGLNNQDGIIIIIGTGSVAFGKNNNIYHRSGGYSPYEGDAGSAYDLGINLLKKLARAIDNRISYTKMLKEVSEELNINTFEKLANYFNKYGANRTHIASLAKYVTKYANLNDLNAIDIIDYATDELALMVKAVDDKLNLKTHKLAIIGSLGNAEGYFKDSFIKKIKQINNNFEIFESLSDPSYGSALKAYELCKGE